MEPNKRGRSNSWGNNRGSRNYWRGRGNYRGANKRYPRNRWKNTTNQLQPDEIAENDGPIQSLITNVYPVIPCPYKGWKLYFPEVAYSENSLHLKRIQLLEEMLLEWKTVVNKEEIQSRGSFTVDAKDLTSYDNLKEEWPSFMEDLKETPENILNSLGLAMHQILFGEIALPEQQGNEVASQSTLSKDFPIVHARIINYEPLTPLKNIKGIYFGKFISIKGSVIRLSSIKSVNTKMTFKCETCGELQLVTFPDWKYMVPTKCSVKECRSRQFVPDCLSLFTETIDWQSIKIQENITDRQRESGRVPRTIECELTSDLVGTCTPGDNVIVTGIVEVLNTTAGNSRQNKDKCTFSLYIHANSVTNCKGNSSDRQQKLNSGISLEFSYKDLYAIQEIQSENNVFRLIVASLCPTIYGHEIVKAGLILGLFGGTSKYTDEKISLSKRGDPHILVVGDPGLGKSQMLQACANIAPRGVYVSANTTTTSGLTVTLTKDSSSDFALEAGALVLADQGCCCIDEFDKMSNQHQALLEAMEQQCISVAKSGVICNMPARTSILAAANPVGGHYNKAKTVSENLKLGSALLSRFDLVFILLDKHDQELDNMLSKHVMAMHSGKKVSLPENQTKKTSLLPEELAAKQQWERDKPLSEYLKFASDETVDPIPHQILRKYVAYARKYVHPEISPEAVKMLKQFYQQLRMNRQTADSTPITTRQLESLIRLTEARARLELREEATDKDAQDVIEIMKHSMIDTYSDEFGLLDFQRSQHGSGMNSRSQAKKFIAVLTRISDQTYNSLFNVQQMRQIAKDAGINVPYFPDFIDSLNNQNYLLKKGPGVYHLQTAGF